jgi:hypothetical protein
VGSASRGPPVNWYVSRHRVAIVTNYDPDIAPDPTIWLALDEQERIQLAEAHHRMARIKLPSVETHALFHTIVENQIAEGLDCVVRAMARLMKEGLSRHDALHAIGSVIAEHLFEAMDSKSNGDPSTMQTRYNAAVERLTANEWRERYGA